MEKEKISVIVAVFNVEKYLKKCVESILNQTYQNLEVILINDGSTDQSGDICNEYAQKDNRVKVISRENRGIAFTRNEGLDTATGDYITFVDSDDYIHPQMYELMMKKLRDNHADVVACDYLEIPENEAVSMGQLDVDKIDIDIIQTKQEKKKYIYLDKYVDALLVWNKIIKKELWDGIRCPKDKIYEDETITFRTLYYAQKIVYLNEKLYYYVRRYSKNSITTTGFSEKRLFRLDALEVRLKFYIEKKEWEFLTEAFFVYKTDFLVIMEHIEKSSDYAMAMLDPYMEKYRKYCRKYLWKMQMPAKKKGQYIFFAVAPVAYYKRYQKNKESINKKSKKS